MTHAWKTLLAVSLGVIVVNIDYWSVAVALPDMAKQFTVSAVSLDWVISAYIISFCATMSIAGRLGDIFGRKKLLLIGTILFGLFSIWVGLCKSIEMIIMARVALGIGAGLIYPLSTAVLGDATPTNTLTKMLGLLTGIGALGAAIGPVVGGILTESLGWPWIFFLNAPIAVFAFCMVLFGTSESKDSTTTTKIDYLGILFLLGGIISLAMWIAKINIWGVTSIQSIIIAACTAISFCLFVKWEQRTANPLINISLFKNRTFLGFVSCGSLSNLFWALAIFTTTIVLQKVFSYDPLKAGLFFLSLSGTVAISSFFLSRVIACIGEKRTMILSLLLQGVGGYILWNQNDNTGILIGLAIAGPGCGWGFSIALVGSIISLPKNAIGLASSAGLTVVVMTGGIGVTLAGAVIESFSKGQTIHDGTSASYVTGIIVCFFAAVLALSIIPRKMSGNANT